MYLHRLDIHGFKSFGRKTKFVFTDGITAIVGPNGCGKSNILDGIRWVLGEQKAGFLRSDRMENVIFNGSKTMKPLGMAEVSLTIHNTKNVLPIDYSEVVITRRLFRSSESQYLLNNAPCRLKDIQNLFMDTGIGPNAYSIIELSMVESILSGRPEERRRILEEAAGVTKYKLRRKAAYRKLDATEADLVRINDIITEVEKNVSSLQRQVRKAQRYQDLKEELKSKEIHLATHLFSKLHSELEPLSKQLVEAQNRREALSADFDQREAELEEVRTELIDIERKLSGRQRELNELSLAIQKKEEEVLVARERRKNLQEKRERLVREREELDQRLEKNRLQFAQTEEKLQQLFQSIQEAEVDFQEKNAALKSAEKRVQEKKAELKRIEERRVELLAGLTERKQAEEREKAHLEHLRERIASMTKDIEEIDLLETIRQEKLTALTEEKANKAGELAEVQKQHKGLLGEIEALGKAKETLKEQILDRRGALQAVKERIALLRRFIESYEDHPEGVQHLLQNDFLNGGFKGTLADNLRVDNRYRVAVETALGEAAVSLVVDKIDEALRCIEILRQDQKGTVTFLPLERFSRQSANGDRAQEFEAAEKLPGVIGWAYDLVDCDRAYRPLVKSLLGEFLVVSDLALAREHAGRLRDLHINLVTLDGEMLSTWGPIRGGSNGHAEVGIVGRKALVEELEHKLEALKGQLAAQEKEYEDKEAHHKRLFEEEQALSENLKSVESRITELDVELAKLSFESKKESESRERMTQERQRLEQDLDDLQQRLRALSPELHHLDEDKQKFGVEYETAYNDLVGLEQDVVQHNTVAQDSRIRLVGLKGEEQRLQEEIGRLQESAREVQANIERTAEERQATDEELAAQEKRMEEVKTSLQGDFETRHRLEQQVNEIQETFRGQKTAIEEKEKAVKEIRIQRDEVAEVVHDLELRTSELQMGADRIRERIKEEYNVTVKKAAMQEELDVEASQEEIGRLKERLRAMEPVNLLALKEYEKEKERLDFLTAQRDDLVDAEANLSETINVINKTARTQFNQVFEKIRENFRKVFSGFFEYGKADLQLEPGKDPLEADIIIEADPKGRRLEALTLLSGGEKALTAISLLFAIYLVKPSPFCILDEVDAPLDDANIGRFVKAIREFSKDTQFILITHNKLTMRAADCLYGVTMEEEGISKVVSVNFKELEPEAQAS